MKKVIACIGVAVILAPRVVLAQQGIVDLTQLANYANQPVPVYINRDNMPNDNPITDLGATLGRVLFYDKRLSRNDTVACASCHLQAHAFGDLPTASSGVSGTTGRHSMRLVNIRFSKEVKMFWDERATSVEDQASKPIQDHVEMGFSGSDGDPSLSDLVAKLSAIEQYQVLFAGVFGDTIINEARIQSALAQFVRSIQSFDSRFDAGRGQVANANDPFPNFTVSENRGKDLFLRPPGPGGGVGCAGCHQSMNFDIDPNSGNNGVVGAIGGGTDFTVTRSPSLRDLVDPMGQPNGPFMHDGSLTTLAAVIEHYNAIPAVVTGLDNRLIRPGNVPVSLNLTTQQKADLVAFLATLTGSNVYTDPRWSTPFDEEGNLSLVVLPSKGLSLAAANGQITLTQNGVPNVYYYLEVDDEITFTNPSRTLVRAGADGSLEAGVAIPTANEQRFFRFVYVPASALN